MSGCSIVISGQLKNLFGIMGICFDCFAEDFGGSCCFPFGFRIIVNDDLFDISSHGI